MRRTICFIFGLILLLESFSHSLAADVPNSTGSPDVLIDVGHGGIDGGTSYGPILEKTINLEIARKVYDRLAQAGITSALNRTGDYALSEDNETGSKSRHRRDLIQRKRIADELQPKLMISLHVNWSSITKRSGPLILCQQNSRSVLLASTLQSSLNSLYGADEKPTIGKTFFLLNHCKTTTVIIEMGFISNDRDRNMLTQENEQKKIAEAVASAVAAYLALSESGEPQGTHGTEGP